MPLPNPSQDYNKKTEEVSNEKNGPNVLEDTSKNIGKTSAANSVLITNKPQQNALSQSLKNSPKLKKADSKCSIKSLQHAEKNKKTFKLAEKDARKGALPTNNKAQKSRLNNTPEEVITLDPEGAKKSLRRQGGEPEATHTIDQQKGQKELFSKRTKPKQNNNSSFFGLRRLFSWQKKPQKSKEEITSLIRGAMHDARKIAIEKAERE